MFPHLNCLIAEQKAMFGSLLDVLCSKANSKGWGRYHWDKIAQFYMNESYSAFIVLRWKIWFHYRMVDSAFTTKNYHVETFPHVNTLNGY